jgi:hypothetical protein
MQSLIISYLLQCGECNLPGIGKLYVKRSTATIDAANKQILPPAEEIIFSKDINVKPGGFIKYIADKKRIELKQAEEQLENVCNKWKDSLQAGEEIELETLGILFKNVEGNIDFKQTNAYNYFEPTPVENIYKPNEVDEISGVRENDNPDLFNADEQEEQFIVAKSNWGLWAIILIAIGSVIIFYNIWINKGKDYFTGNQTKVVADSSKITYQKPR